MRRISFVLTLMVCLVTTAFAQEITQGTLEAFGKKRAELGICPLKQTTVNAEISGFVSRVRVTQEFENSFQEPIEAVYVFPLPHDAAVDDMTMRIGERTIRAKIMKRDEARKVYETARDAGQTASLLDQERPNIFTQSVANILPNEKIIVEISYVATLKYEDGSYEFVFPMTIGPRYIPGSVKAEDAATISPPVTKTRAGHDISINLKLNTGVPVEEIRSTSHEIETINLSPNEATIKLKDEKVIPNKDFILHYDVSGKRIEDALLTHADSRGGFFSLILQPPDKFAVEDVTPKEIVFVLDTSGSMSGFPIEKAKEAMRMSLEGLYPNDTFNLITFAGDTKILFESPVPATPANLKLAKDFMDSEGAGGGTEMMKAIKAALDPSDSKSHLRIVCFMTDAFVGNEGEIISEIQKHPNARVFSFGIGSSVNRFLLDKMAKEGRGEVEYVGLNDDGSAAAKRFYERVRSPLLTDVAIDWNGLPVADVYPKRSADLFSAKPVFVFGRYTKSANSVIRLKGKIGGQEYVREIPVVFPETSEANESLSTLWARARIDELTTRDENSPNAETQKAAVQTITQIGLEFRLMTAYTSFVAVEEKVVTQNGTPTRIEVPIDLPDGMDPANATIDGQDVSFRKMEAFALLMKPGLTTAAKSASGGGGGGGRTHSAKRRSSKSVWYGQGSGQGSGSGSGVPAGLGSSQVVNVTSSSIANASSSRRAIEKDISKREIPLTSAMKRQKLIDEKFHIWIADLVKRIEKKNPVSENEAKFVKDGKADVQIWLTEKAPAVLDQLKQLGLEIVSERDARILVGRIAIEKLAALAEFEKVKYVLPEIKKSSLLENRVAEKKAEISFFGYLFDLLRGAIFSPTMNSNAQALDAQTREVLCDAQRQSHCASV